MNTNLIAIIARERNAVCRLWRELLNDEWLLADVRSLSFVVERAFDQTVSELGKNEPVRGLIGMERPTRHLAPMNAFYAAGNQAIRETVLQACAEMGADAQAIARAAEQVSLAVCEVQAREFADRPFHRRHFVSASPFPLPCAASA